MWLLNFIVACIILYAVCAFIKFLFDNFIISRILSIACSGFLIYIAAIAPADVGDELWIASIFVAVFSWLFYRGGDNVFDLEYTGWVTTYMDGHEEWETVGGFAEHFIKSALCFGAIYFFIAESFPIVYYIVPIVLIVLNIVSFFKGEV